MLTNNAKCIFCDNVTCFGTNKCCSNRSHLLECCIKAPHFLLAMALSFFTEHPRFFYLFLGGDVRNRPDSLMASFRLRVFHWHLESRESAPFTHESIPNVQEARERFKKTRSLCVMWGLLAMFRNKKWFFWESNLSSEFHEYRPLSSCHALPADRRNKALECWLATLNASSAIMSHALEQTNAARIGVICQGASSKLPTCCLHGYSVSLPRITPDSLMASCLLQVVDWHLESRESAPFTHTHEVSHLMSTSPNMREARERFKKTRSLCVMWGLLAMFRNRKWLYWDLPISVPKSPNIALRALVMHCLLIEETRRWNAD